MPIELDIRTTEAWCPGLSIHEARSLAEAASVALDLVFHRWPIADKPAKIAGAEVDPIDATVVWEDPSVEAKSTNADPVENAERGATSVAFVTLGVICRMRIVKRLWQGTGADYLAVVDGAPDNDFIRVEVSGLGESSETINTRTNKKQRQLQKGSKVFDRPGVGVIVAFRAPVAIQIVRC